MNIFDTYTHRLLDALNRLEVQYIVVGGYAVNHYGYRRTTGDIDLWIKPDNGINKQRIIEAFRNLGVANDQLVQLGRLDFSKPLVFIDGEEPFKIDFLTAIQGVTFDEAWNERVITSLEGLSIPFIHFDHLILSKIGTSRPKDKADIEMLQKLRRLTEANNSTRAQEPEITYSRKPFKVFTSFEEQEEYELGEMAKLSSEEVLSQLRKFIDIAYGMHGYEPGKLPLKHSLTIVKP